MRRATAAAALALLVAPASAARAAPWSAPQAVPGAYLARWDASNALKEAPALLGFTPGGSGLAVLGLQAGGRGISRFTASGFGALSASKLGGVEPSLMALYGREGMLVGGQANEARDARSPLNPELLLDAAVSRGSGTGSFSRRQILGKGVMLGSAAPATVTALAANASGDAAAVVSVPVAGRVQVAGYQSSLFVRRRGQGAFKKVAAIGRRTVGRSPAALAVNGPGDVLVAWDDRADVRARLVTADGRPHGEQRLGQGGSAFVFGGRIVAAMDATRRSLVAWIAQRVGEGAYAGSPGTVAFAYASPYHGFGTAQVLQRDLPKGPRRAIGAPGVRAALLRNRGVVVWTGFASGHYVVRAVDVTSGRAGAISDLSGPGADARLRGLAVGPRGGTVATWSVGSELDAAARAPDAASWGATETITSSAAGDLPPDAPVAADPVSGDTVALWSDPVQPPPSLMPVRFSTRAADAS